jgi:hypothetical protein
MPLGLVAVRRLSLGLTASAVARTWEVGPSRAITSPEQVADGDNVVLAPGIYRNCAIWQASRLNVEGRSSLRG